MRQLGSSWTWSWTANGHPRVGMVLAILASWREGIWIRVRCSKDWFTAFVLNFFVLFVSFVVITSLFVATIIPEEPYFTHRFWWGTKRRGTGIFKQKVAWPHRKISSWTVRQTRAISIPPNPLVSLFSSLLGGFLKPPALQVVTDFIIGTSFLLMVVDFNF